MLYSTILYSTAKFTEKQLTFFQLYEKRSFDTGVFCDFLLQNTGKHWNKRRGPVTFFSCIVFFRTFHLNKFWLRLKKISIVFIIDFKCAIASWDDSSYLRYSAQVYTRKLRKFKPFIYIFFVYSSHSSICYL